MTSYIEQLQAVDNYKKSRQNQFDLQQFLHKAKLSNCLFIGFESDAFFRIENRQTFLGKTHELHWLISKNVAQISIREDLKTLEKPIALFETLIVRYLAQLEKLPQDMVILAPNNFRIAYTNQVLKNANLGIKASSNRAFDNLTFTQDGVEMTVINFPIQDYLILTSLSNLNGKSVLHLDENNALLCNNFNAVFYAKL